MSSATWRSRVLFVIAIAAAPCAALAGGPHGGESRIVGGVGRPAFLDHVFRPALVMRNQQAIGLTAEQRDAIKQAIHETQQRLLDLQWQLDARSEEAAKVFAPDRIDQDSALTHAAAVIVVEDQIKKEHLRLLIRIKNELTPEQQEKLRELRPKRHSRERQ